MSTKAKSPARVGMLSSLFTMKTSFSVPTLLARTESVIARHYETRSLPSEVAGLDTRRRRVHLAAFLRECDAAVVPAVISSRHLLEVFASRPRPDFPIIYVPVGELPRGAMIFRRALRRFSRRDVVAVSCGADVGIVRGLTDRLAPRLRIIPYGVDTDAYAPLAPDHRRAIRASLGYTPEDVVLFYVGRVTAEKNVHALIALYQQLARTNKRLRLIVDGPLRDDRFHEFGTGPLPIERILRQQVGADPGSAGGVRFIQADRPVPLPTLCAASDIFVNLTLNHDENFGLAIVEAMSCGIPVVGSAWGGQKDTVTDGEVGFLAGALPSGRGFAVDIGRAAVACRALAASPSLRRRMGAAGRQRALELYSLDAYANNWHALLRECLAGGSSTPGANRLSGFGRRFQRAFSEPAVDWQRRLCGGSKWASWPLYGADDGAAQALYRELIAPYGSKPARTHLRPEDTLSLRSPFTRLTREAVRVDDPLWPGIVPLKDEVGRDIVKALQGGRVRADDLRRKLDVSWSALVAGLASLIEEGVIVKSAQ